MEPTTTVITLPSNSSSDIYPENTTANFRVELPKALEFDGPHEVALTGFCYPKSWYNFPSHHQFSLRLTTVSGSLPPLEIDLPSGYYDSVEDALKIIDRKVKRENYPLVFKYSSITQKVKIYCVAEFPDVETYEILMSGRLALKLGFTGADADIPHTRFLTRDYEAEEESGRVLPPVGLLAYPLHTILAPHTVQMHTIDLIYVNCNLASDAHVVGGMRVPLLKTVPVTGAYGTVVSYEPRVLDWFPLRNSRIKTITVLITDGEGRPVPFERGHLTVKVHVRRARPI